MATLYYLSPFSQTGWIEKHTTPESTPVFNDKLGDLAHSDPQAAERLAFDIARDPAVDDKGMDILVVDIEDKVYEALVRRNMIRPAAEHDPFGGELTHITGEGAQLLNGGLSYMVRRLIRPEKLN